MEAHPKMVPLLTRAWDDYGLFHRKGFGMFGALGELGNGLNRVGIVGRAMMKGPVIASASHLDRACTYTYRTPDYQLSSVQDRRPGEGQCQALYWTAVLGLDAVVFTTHPGRTLVGEVVRVADHPS